MCTFLNPHTLENNFEGAFNDLVRLHPPTISRSLIIWHTFTVPATVFIVAKFLIFDSWSTSASFWNSWLASVFWLFIRFYCSESIFWNGSNLKIWTRSTRKGIIDFAVAFNAIWISLKSTTINNWLNWKKKDQKKKDKIYKKKTKNWGISKWT